MEIQDLWYPDCPNLRTTLIAPGGDTARPATRLPFARLCEAWRPLADLPLLQRHQKRQVAEDVHFAQRATAARAAQQSAAATVPTIHGRARVRAPGARGGGRCTIWGLSGGKTHASRAAPKPDYSSTQSTL